MIIVIMLYIYHIILICFVGLPENYQPPIYFNVNSASGSNYCYGLVACILQHVVFLQVRHYMVLYIGLKI